MGVVEIHDIGERDECGTKPEYVGRKLKILLSDNGFMLVDTSDTRNIQNHENAWIWHTCDAYERHMVQNDAENSIIGLMSNREIYFQRCKYCQLQIPDGIIGQWKLMNWEHMNEITSWDFDG